MVTPRASVMRSTHGFQPANQLAHRRAGLAHRLIAHDELVAQQPDDHGGVAGVEHAQGLVQRVEVARDDRVLARVQLGAAEHRAEAAEQVIRS